MDHACELGDAQGRRIQTGSPSGKLADLGRAGLVEVALGDVGRIEVQVQVRSCSRMRPLSVLTRGRRRMNASRPANAGGQLGSQRPDLGDWSSALLNNEHFACLDLLYNIACLHVKVPDAGGLPMCPIVTHGVCGSQGPSRPPRHNRRCHRRIAHWNHGENRHGLLQRLLKGPLWFSE